MIENSLLQTTYNRIFLMSPPGGKLTSLFFIIKQIWAEQKSSVCQKYPRNLEEVRLLWLISHVNFVDLLNADFSHKVPSKDRTYYSVIMFPHSSLLNYYLTLNLKITNDNIIEVGEGFFLQAHRSGYSS